MSNWSLTSFLSGSSWGSSLSPSRDKVLNTESRLSNARQLDRRFTSLHYAPKTQKQINSFYMVREIPLSKELFISVKFREKEDELREDKSFAYWGIAKHLPINAIFLRDPHQTHYHRGIPGVGNDLYEISNQIAEFIRCRNINNVVILGASAGAYGALAFAKLIEIRCPKIRLRCHSYDPQTHLRYLKHKKDGSYRWGYIKNPSPTPELMDLRNLFNQNVSRGNQSYTIVTGTEKEDYQYGQYLQPLQEAYSKSRSLIPRSRLRIQKSPETYSEHGSEMVRQYQDGRLLSLMLKEFKFWS